LNFLATKEPKGHKEIFSAIIGPPSLKLWRGWLWKNFAGRRCEQESAAAAFSCSQPDGLHGLGRVLRSSTVFRQPSASIRVHLRLKK
jgi:hypothetical protein